MNDNGGEIVLRESYRSESFVYRTLPIAGTKVQWCKKFAFPKTAQFSLDQGHCVSSSNDGDTGWVQIVWILAFEFSGLSDVQLVTRSEDMGE